MSMASSVMSMARLKWVVSVVLKVAGRLRSRQYKASLFCGAVSPVSRRCFARWLE